MKKLLIGLLFGICSVSHAINYQAVRASTDTALTPTLQTGTMNLSSGTVTNLNTTTLKGATGTFTGTVTAGTFSPASAFGAILAATNTWTGGQIYKSSSTFAGAVVLSSNVIDGSASQGTAGQSLQSNAGSAPTWVNVPSAILSTTSTWTAGQTFASSVTVNGNEVHSGTATFTGRISTSTTAGFGTSGMALQSQGASAAPTWAYTGLVSNIQKFSATSSSATAATSFVRTGYSVSITPKVLTSSVAVLATCDLTNGAVQTSNVYATLERSATNLGGANGLMSCDGGLATTGAFSCPVTLFYIDAPNSISAVTYEVYLRSSGGGVSVTWNGQSTTCNIFAWEIGG